MNNIIIIKLQTNNNTHCARFHSEEFAEREEQSDDTNNNFTVISQKPREKRSKITPKLRFTNLATSSSIINSIRPRSHLSQTKEPTAERKKVLERIVKKRRKRDTRTSRFSRKRPRRRIDVRERSRQG